MTVLIVQGQTWAAFAEAFQSLGRNEQFQALRRLAPNVQVHEDPVQRDPPKKRHHDHLIQRHVRSHQHQSRRP